MTQKLTVARPFHVRRGKHGGKDHCQGESATRPPLGRVPRVARLMALAIRFDGLMRQGMVKDQAELARLGHVSRARVTQIMNLLCLPPDIQEAVLFLPRTHRGRDRITERHLRKLAATPDWQTQRRLWQELVVRTMLASGAEPNLVVNQNGPAGRRVGEFAASSVRGAIETWQVRLAARAELCELESSWSTRA